MFVQARHQVVTGTLPGVIPAGGKINPEWRGSMFMECRRRTDKRHDLFRERLSRLWCHLLEMRDAGTIDIGQPLSQ
jgi:hypothetical protein